MNNMKMKWKTCTELLDLSERMVGDEIKSKDGIGAVRVVQVVEPLPSKGEALSLNPVPPKRKMK
jgi:hypothetical protein